MNYLEKKQWIKRTLDAEIIFQGGFDIAYAIMLERIKQVQEEDLNLEKDNV